MKNKKARSFGVIIMVIGFLVNSALSEVNITNHGGVSLPRESENNPAFRGESWQVAATNWMQLLRQGGNTLGTGRTLVVRKSDLGDYREMITSTAVRTWKGMDDSFGPTVEWGNFWHQGVQIRATGGDTFIPANVTVSVQSFRDSGPGSTTTTNFAELNFFRQVLNADNTVSAVQNSSLPATNFLYGGVGRALTMSGTGTTQQQLDATADYWWSQNYRLVYTVTVPYRVGGVGPTQTKTMSWEVARRAPKLALVNGNLELSGLAVGKTYYIQNSATLSNWQNLHAVTATEDNWVFPAVHWSNKELYPKMFYRTSSGE
jgi:hypothetical protein